MCTAKITQEIRVDRQFNRIYKIQKAFCSNCLPPPLAISKNCCITSCPE